MKDGGLVLFGFVKGREMDRWGVGRKSSEGRRLFMWYEEVVMCSWERHGVGLKS